MDELLEALRSRNKDRVKELAPNLFLKKNGELNVNGICNFEKFAPCRISIFLEYGTRRAIGSIVYDQQMYYFMS